MAHASGTIIQAIKKDYPQNELPVIRNCTDLDVVSKKRVVNQYVLGITEPDTFHGDISHYERNMKTELAEVSNAVKCLGWKFNEGETAELREVLLEVAEEFDIDMDIEQLFDRAKVRRNPDKSYYFVVTVIQYHTVYI